MCNSHQRKLEIQITQCDKRLQQLRNEIVDLLERRKALQHALDEYCKMMPKHALSHATSHSKSKISYVLDLIRASGSQGATTSELYEKTIEAGIHIKRNTLRSQLWQRKEAKILEQLPNGRYRFVHASDTTD